jgi:hypothetical protein
VYDALGDYGRASLGAGIHNQFVTGFLVSFVTAPPRQIAINQHKFL